MNIFGLDKETMKGTSSVFTLTEIYQQPTTWKKTCEQVKKMRDEIQAFIDQVITHEDFDVILTGAGTSEFVGNALFPALSAKLNYKVKSYGTTDIVSSPENFLSKSKPTLLISFGRSGNSPESVGAIDVAEVACDNVYNLVITCNKDGELSKRAEQNENYFAINLAEETHDQSFAMTSSFSNMYLAAYLCFNLDALNEITDKVNHAGTAGELFFSEKYTTAKAIVDEFDFSRIVYLGSNSLKGIAQESALKMLELTAGKVATMFDTPLGFRHGPKSIVDDSTLTVVYLSDSEYTRQYEIDLLKEMSGQRKGNKLVAIMNKSNQVVSDLVDYSIAFDLPVLVDNAFLGLDFIIFAQTLAALKSLEMGITPDNPCPTGEVNRVVQGVTIYRYKRKQNKLGIIVTGHGNFATGLQSSLELIAGKQTDIAFVDFEAQDSTESLSEKLDAATYSLSNCDGILVMADLVGGSPFKTAVEHQIAHGKIETIGGANLPMIIEASLSRFATGSLSELKCKALQAGKDNITPYARVFRKKAVTEEDGI